MSNPITSMTGFARTEHTGGWGTLTYEIRTINHRYLDVAVRLPEVLRALEVDTRDRIRQALSRGKVELHVHFRPNGEGTQLKVDQSIAKAYADALMEVKALFPHDIQVNLCDVLTMPGVLAHAQTDMEALAKPFMQGLDDALNALQAMRAREGAGLKSFLQSRCEAIASQVAALKPHLSEMLTAAREKLTNRLNQAAVLADENRIEQELVLWASRADVEEEMDRLLAHVDAVKKALNDGGAIGRRLDFLMQELNREANTLSSKAQSLTSTNTAVEMKVLIEQMREQVQNME
jgi:uncharacterized protein (TIGR00255 family)